MASRRQAAWLLLLCAGVYGASSPAAADASATSAKLQQKPHATPIDPHRVNVASSGSVAAGCSLCRDSGNCSVAVNDTASGVFCGDLHLTASSQPCCCPYFTECRVTSKSQACECSGAWPFTAQQRHERLAATEAANETQPLPAQDSFLPQDDPMDSQMAVSTEILIHLSAYLALFVFAVYVDQWVECFSDFRRNRMVTYTEAVDMKLLRFRQRFGKRRRDSEVGTETDDNLPLLVLESPAPSSSPVFTFGEVPEAATDSDTGENEAPPEQCVMVTVPDDAVREVSASPPVAPMELEEIPLE